MAREPQPSLQDEWSAWEPYPQRQPYWPGLGVEHTDGYEVNSSRLQAIGMRLMTELNETAELLSGSLVSDRYDRMGYWPTSWMGAQTWAWYVGGFEDTLALLTMDVMRETAMGARLVATSGHTYELADQAPWLPKHGSWIAADQSHRYEVTGTYPSGSVKLSEPHENIEKVIEHWTATDRIEDTGRDFIRLQIMSWKPGTLTDHAREITVRADRLVEFMHGLMSRAQDMRGAPWRGTAADHAQQTLRQIFETARGLAAVWGQIAQGLTAAAGIVATAQSRFDAVVNKGGWEFSDLWNGDDEDARRFLREVDRQLADVLRQMPQTARIDLPGLIPKEQRRISP
ncbi:WXG100 family type VII secretion target [Nonomuraea sp. NBC_01738]|uniref:WXG100 family type VII secretion target n=1 Tax=Nonomuraea sp. NBC_01738 TaxID=2976003 RepID=UPI002E126ED9|nr:WXG100 family type VII secretion target [Nonomuraea sp. NBC_01738]